MRIVLAFDVERRTTEPPIPRLSPKHFSLLLYLALRATDEGEGWVTRQEIVTRVPLWKGETPRAAGREIWRLDMTKPWFGEHVEFEASVNAGPWRFLGEATFQPDRDAANRFIAKTMTARRVSRRDAPPEPISIPETELLAYDQLVQHGVYLPSVVDLVLQRLGDPERIVGTTERIAAYRVLATLGKNRGQLAEARSYAEKGLALAQSNDAKDDVAYFMDQLGGIAHIEKNGGEARRWFEDEIAFLTAWGTGRATFHLAGACRGLAAVLFAKGDRDGAKGAIEKSLSAAKASGNEEAERMAEVALAGASLSAEAALPAADELPTEHMIARVMALNGRAAVALERGDRHDGERLLRLAHREAVRLGLAGQVANAEATARKFSVRLVVSPRRAATDKQER